MTDQPRSHSEHDNSTHAYDYENDMFGWYVLGFCYATFIIYAAIRLFVING